MTRIEGAVALVTGASSGIGASIAVELARRGAVVVGTARRHDELEATAERCRAHTSRSLAITADLADAADCRRVIDETGERAGPIDILVNNAGVPLHRPALDTTPDDIEWVMRVNFLAAVHTTMAVLPAMVERGAGSVVNVTSVAGAIPNPSESAYGASKAALDRWSHGLAVDLAGTGVHIGVLSPGPIDTPIWELDSGPGRYGGRKYPPEVVAAAAARMIERGELQATVPRPYGAIGALYGLPLLNRAIRRGLVAYSRR